MLFRPILWDQDLPRSLCYGPAVLAFLQITRTTANAGETSGLGNPSDISPRDANSLDKISI